jgi:hypothetical protein
MHVCEEFREKITEQILDRVDLDNNLEVQRELMVCNSCTDFYMESRDLIEAMSGVRFDVGETQWEGMADRMRDRILAEYAERTRPTWLERLGITLSLRPYVPAMAGVLGMALLAVGLFRAADPVINEGPRVLEPVSQTVVLGEPDAALDSVTVEYLEQSELLLRSVMKLRPSHADDLEDARLRATQQLVELRQRKAAASDVPRVVNVMDKYEMILREVRNLNDRPAAEDIIDIQNRIQKNKLIANMQAFQPKVAAVEAEFDRER